MDGILVCFHNTIQVFGFQYISREEMDEALYGSVPFADGAFIMCMKTLELILDKVTEKYHGENIRLTLNISKCQVCVLIFYQSLNS